MAGHEDETIFLGQIHQFLALCHGTGHGFFNERVFAGQQAGLGHRIVGINASGNDHRIEIDPIEHVIVIGLAGDLGIKRFKVLEPRRVEIAHDLELAIRQRPEIPDQIRSPVTAASDTYFDFF